MKTILLLLASCAAAAAQSGGAWSITSSTFDGGGDTSSGIGVSGAGWKVTGTIGQPDAASQRAAGGVWSVAGGFWPGIVTVPGGPPLTIFAYDAHQMTVAWTTAAIGYKLQTSTDLRTWTDYTGTIITDASNITWPLRSGPRYFFRLKKP